MRFLGRIRRLFGRGVEPSPPSEASVDRDAAVGAAEEREASPPATARLLLFKAHRLQGRRELDGLHVSIENRVGSVRYWTDHDGTEGKTKLTCSYGYIRGSQAQDGEEVDCFLGPLARDHQVDGTTVYVVRTRKPPEFLEVDESKCMIGFADLDAARAAFLAHYSDDARFIDQIDAVPWDDFKGQVIATKDIGGFIRGDVVDRHQLTKARMLLRFFAGVKR